MATNQASLIPIRLPRKYSDLSSFLDKFQRDVVGSIESDARTAQEAAGAAQVTADAAQVTADAAMTAAVAAQAAADAAQADATQALADIAVLEASTAARFKEIDFRGAY